MSMHADHAAVPEPPNLIRAVEVDAEAHARELERRAAAAVDPCERERLLYLAHFARGGRMDENGRQP